MKEHTKRNLINRKTFSFIDRKCSKKILNLVFFFTDWWVLCTVRPCLSGDLRSLTQKFKL
jgi:hypothetical protein